MLRRLLSSALIALVGLAACGFFHLKPRNAYISNYGLCHFAYTQTYEAPDAITGEAAMVEGITWLKKTSRVPAELGVSFGLEYVINNDSDEPMQVEEVIIFPPAGLTNPESGKNQKSETFPGEIYPGEVTFTCYSFDYPWEIVKGTWTFQVRSGDKLILQKEFLVE